MAGGRYGINIGTQNIGISSVSTREILVEKNIIAIKNRKLAIAYGDEAYAIFERAPENVEVVFPVQNGVISDPSKMTIILEGLYKKLCSGKIIKGSDFLIAIPTDTTEVEKRAFHELIADSRLRPHSVSMIDKCIADAIDCGIEPTDGMGNMIVNIGADTTDISVIAMGSIVSCRTLKYGGNRFTELIINAVKQKEGVLLGFKSAEKLKCTLVDLTGSEPEKELSLYGQTIATGLPARLMISRQMATSAVYDAVLTIVDDIKRVLERATPEIVADVNKNGIYLVGGSANLGGLARFLANETKMKINLVKKPENSTIRGVTRAFNNQRYDSVRYYPQEKDYD